MTVSKYTNLYSASRAYKTAVFPVLDRATGNIKEESKQKKGEKNVLEAKVGKRMWKDVS